MEATMIGEFEAPMSVWVISAIKKIAQKKANKERIFAFILS